MNVEAEFTFTISQAELGLWKSITSKLLNSSRRIGFVKDFTDDEFELLQEIHEILTGETGSNEPHITADRRTFDATE